MSWDHLKALAHETPEPGKESAWLHLLCTELAALAVEKRKEALADVSRLLSAAPAAPRWVALLADAGNAVARHLALAVTAWLPVPVEHFLVSALRSLLADKRIPGSVRLDAATVLLQSTDIAGAEGEGILRSLVARTGKARAVDRLRLLMQRLGKLPPLEQFCTQLEAQIRMRCPRCRTQLHRPEMAQHLWAEHGLVLEGRRVREPWHLVADWIEEYRRWGNPELLDRCRDLAQRLEGQQGLMRVHRLFLSNGIADETARQALLEEAEQGQAALCPACWALVPVSRRTASQSLTESHGRLSGSGFTVEVSEQGLSPVLEITTPNGLVFRGREPQRQFTRRGATVLLVGPAVLLALLIGLAHALFSLSSVWPVVLPLALALLIECGIQLYWQNEPPGISRAIDHGWQRLVPRLHMSGPAEGESSFLAGLARASLRRGNPAARAEELRRLLREAEQAVRTGQAAVSHMAALRGLALVDAARTGQEVMPLLAAQIRRCLIGELPLAYADELLGSEHGLLLYPFERAMLRVRLCDAAFEAGLEVRDLLAAARAAPALGAVLEAGRHEVLAQLRLLWSMRPQKPWRRCGDARTVFELAAGPPTNAEHFSRHPDLLLADLEAPWILLTSRGIVLHEHIFTEMPARIDVRETREVGETVWELIVGEKRLAFRGNPTPLRARLEGWMRFFFGEFLARCSQVWEWQPPSPPRILVAHEAAACPECRTLLWARPGDVGRAVRAGPEETPEPTARAG